MGLSEKRVGHLTIKTFFKLYQAYKNTFDLELRLYKNNITYAELEEKQVQDEEWF